MTWAQTWREWGNERVLRGNAHFMLSSGKALCGYVPHGRTRMRPLDRLTRPEAVQRCQRCQRAVDKLARGA